MSRNFKKSLFFIIGVIWLIPINTLASNFVCGQDLDGNGVLDSSGETSSCTQIGSEQFCSIGAINCNIKYQCDINNEKYESYASCSFGCGGSTSTELSRQWQSTFVYYRQEHWRSDLRDTWELYINLNNLPFVRESGNGTPPNFVIVDGTTYVKKEIWERVRRNPYDMDRYGVEMISNSIGICTENSPACPIAGNSCINNNGIQQCSPNKCIDLDTTPAEEVTPPSVVTLDDGNRTAQGACTDQALMFSGRNLSCKKSGLTKNCCKDTDVVFNDSMGSLASSIVRDQAMKATQQMVLAAYAEYSSLIASGAGAELAATGASWAAEGAISSFGVDPTTIAISIAISVVTEFVACGQQDTEAAILKGSGYCHFVGTYCSKKWPSVGCVVKSESHCCFNSKLGRIIQEQGREQMGMDWGSAESPSCGGFTPDQFQSLDFSRIDMSEYYGDIQAKSTSLIQQNITQGVEDYYRQIQK
ncbi:IncF plasmid conjugative transfer protein TraN [uncultured Gammaproteobacteria bacterium]|uniref:conjugal transfer protein TraN n=1 Tax=Bathymodiolus heckerae thiotrophic gill symbiont TaxID=1052212 RepID=UPI0010B8ED7F|nr:conjugal transfer protein TraN [Bathymodiolus heckerae thiotrophic gill symbiont]CAC9585828.1 IncF plasmid conjugative transfer protein TraN [uncultured Gammaproteobacteria bacterium]CAC9605013.1 IncF plasmid conjugative transfer protein TraN [uncultured Gammaproteobacteria bacterium]SHN89526.1 IncF plasmid conjugative transfer protein TraN [Bathymodiolus heckerae thiotrophic gill symbiont]